MKLAAKQTGPEDATNKHCIVVIRKQPQTHYDRKHSQGKVANVMPQIAPITQTM